MKSPIVLLTDFGNTDYYAGVLKAVILKIHAQVTVLDLTHGISPQNIMEAALNLKNAYAYYPRGSIFVCIVDPAVGTARKILCVKTQKYFFISPDNGLLSLALKEVKDFFAVSIVNQKYFLTQSPSLTFQGRDIMAPVAAHLFKRPGMHFMRKLGPPVERIQRLDLPKVRLGRDSLEGEILYFDHFGNAITNIHRDLRPRSFWEKAFVALRSRELGRIQSTYGTKLQSVISVFNSSGYLEIARVKGSARGIRGVTEGAQVRVKGRHV